MTTELEVKVVESHGEEDRSSQVEVEMETGGPNKGNRVRRRGQRTGFAPGIRGSKAKMRGWRGCYVTMDGTRRKSRARGSKKWLRR